MTQDWVTVAAVELAKPGVPIRAEAFWTAVAVWIRDPQYWNRSILRADLHPTRLGTESNDWLVEEWLCAEQPPALRRCLRPRIHRHRILWQDLAITNTATPHRRIPGRVTVTVRCLAPKTGSRESGEDSENGSDYVPAQFAAQIPFFHPKVAAYRLEWDATRNRLSVACLACHDQLATHDHTVSTFVHILGRLGKFIVTNDRCESGYTKRVHHDQLVQRTHFQDTYGLMKAKYGAEWATLWRATEHDTLSGDGSTRHGNMSTDPQKHVFEELAIATYLKCLWSDMYGGERGARDSVRFVDLGCGNGFLTYLLTMELFQGYGVDLAKRSLWDVFPGEVDVRVGCIQADQSVYDPFMESLVALDALKLLSLHVEGEAISAPSKHIWLLGNHADELTAWIPIIAARTNRHLLSLGHGPCHLFILPCCFFDLAGCKNRVQTPDWMEEAGEHRWQPMPSMPSLTGGRYEKYVQYVTKVSNWCGYRLEPDFLRIPSTKNLALVGRTCWLEETANHPSDQTRWPTRAPVDPDAFWRERAQRADQLAQQHPFLARLTDSEKARLKRDKTRAAPKPGSDWDPALMMDMTYLTL